MARTRRKLGRATIGLVAVLTVAISVAAFFLGQSLKTEPAPDVVVESSDPTVTQLQSIGELAVLRVNVADILETTGYEYKGAFLIRGDALIAVDLRLAQFQSADGEAKKLVVLLPPPKVIQPRVDHEKTKTYDVSKTTWIPFIGDADKLRDESMREAQRLVQNASTGEDVMNQARSQTELMLTNMYRFIGWQVDVVWQEDSETS